MVVLESGATMSGFGSVVRHLAGRVGSVIMAGALLSTGAAVIEVATPLGASVLPGASASVATGTGGQFIPLQGRLMNTITGVGGYTTPMADLTYRDLTVNGQAGLPSSGISAVQLTMTAVNPESVGFGYLVPSDVAETPPVLVYGSGPNPGTVSNTAIVAVGPDGKIKVMTTGMVDVIVDVQGYYTAGNVAAGGFVPIDGRRVADTRDGTGVTKAKLVAGSTTTIQITGNAVSSYASAAFLNLTVVFAGTTVPGTGWAAAGVKAPSSTYGVK